MSWFPEEEPMRESLNKANSRRHFLQFLAGSPLLALAGFSFGSLANLAAAPAAQGDDFIQFVDLRRHRGPMITRPEQAVDVFDFVPVAEKNIPPAHFGWLVTSTGDDSTLRNDEEAFKRFTLRPRRLVDMRNVDMSVELFGTTWNSPIILAPVGGLAMYYPDADTVVARGARAKSNLLMVSSGATASVEDVTAARGAPVWYQLYPTDVWEITRALVKRAEAAGCPAIVLTVDDAGGNNRETAKFFMRADTRNCTMCHSGGNPEIHKRSFTQFARKHPMYSNLDVSKVTSMDPPTMTWDFVKRLRDLTTKKLLIKGILRGDDAQLAVENGVDGVIVSNHGGRTVSSGPSTIESLPGVVKAVNGKIPVLVDSGFRRGTDIFKALALGATGICIGRPYVYGVGAFGQPGVETVLEILRRELLIAMRQAGTTSIDKITRGYIERLPGPVAALP